MTCADEKAGRETHGKGKSKLSKGHVLFLVLVLPPLSISCSSSSRKRPDCSRPFPLLGRHPNPHYTYTHHASRKSRQAPAAQKVSCVNESMCVWVCCSMMVVVVVVVVVRGWGCVSNAAVAAATSSLQWAGKMLVGGSKGFLESS